jgi:putative transposase
MANKALVQHKLNIRQSCRAFGISATCYRYEAKLSDENPEIADWLLRLTAWQRNGGFGLCFFVSAQCERLLLEP